MTKCVVCNKAIEVGEQRTAEGRGYGGVTMHTRCNHKSPVPHFTEADEGDTVEVITKNGAVCGVIEGKGPLVDPVEGYCLNVHAEQWDSLPTDQVLVVHRKKRESWGEVWLWCNNIRVSDDGEIMDNWENYGKVRDMEVTKVD